MILVLRYDLEPEPVEDLYARDDRETSEEAHHAANLYIIIIIIIVVIIIIIMPPTQEILSDSDILESRFIWK